MALMRSIGRCGILLLIANAPAARADVLLDSYEGDVHPWDAGFNMGAFPCDNECNLSLENGYLVFRWLGGVELINYSRFLSNMFGEPPPPETFWVEWRFRSDRLAASTNSSFCDAKFTIAYKHTHDVVYMLGDAVISSGQTAYRLFPDREFRTFRFESLDGISYRIYVEGDLFFELVDDQNYLGVYFQMLGEGGCLRNIQTEAQVNEWDFVRWGEIGYGEQLVSADPPAGVVDVAAHPNLDRFTVTFDSPNYVLLDEITVSVQGLRDQGTQGRSDGVPIVIATRRLDNGPTDTVEIVLDRPLPLNATTTFTIDDGQVTSVVAYTYAVLQSCCFSSGVCEVLPASECSAQGGVAGTSASCEGDTDGDGRDGVCGDACPGDPAKTAPGLCGCGFPDLDSDDDTVADCIDQCPEEDDRIDTNGDNIPDCAQFIGIPATTTWGLTILALLLVIGAKVGRVWA